jgi:hypothetical protein
MKNKEAEKKDKELAALNESNPFICEITEINPRDKKKAE